MDLSRKTLKLIKKEGLISDGDRVLLGFSGGIDSATLLFVLMESRKELPFDLAVAHVNHLLRQDESERDELFVKNTAKRYGIPFYIEKADVRGYASSNGLSLQHAGRDIRYRFFNELANSEGYSKIAIAHNLDDQVETFLLRLLKGTGIHGLSSIPLIRSRIIRPFLYTYRSEIASFAETKAIQCVFDSSNEKTVYERNFIRHRIIPPMEELNPAFREKIVALLMDLTEINVYLDGKKRSFLEKHVNNTGGEIIVHIDDIKHLDRETNFRVLSGIMMSCVPGFIPLREHIRLIEKMINSGHPNLRLNLPSRLLVKKIYDNLIFSVKPLPETIMETFPLMSGRNIIARLNIDLTVSSPKKLPAAYPKDPFSAYFDRDKIGTLVIRTFRPGDRFQPLGMRGTVKLKDFFIARKIPLEERRHVPLLLSDDRIIWIAGHRIDDRYKINENTKRALKVRVKKITIGT